MDHVNLAELCAATSLFTDLGAGQPTEHGLRTCLVAMRLSAALGLDAAVCGEVFYVSLLRYLGCTADSHELGRVAGDEVRFLAGMAPVTMGSPREEIVRLIGLVGAGQRLPQRLRALARVIADPKGGERLTTVHCEVAGRLATDMGLPEGVAAALEVGYARWDGTGVPAGLAGDDIPMSARVSIVARDLEVWARETSGDAVREMLTSRRGRAYDPTVVDAALEIGTDRLRDCDGDLWHAVVALEPWPPARVSGPELLGALRAFGDYADLKLPERSGYARRVERVASAAAGIAGLGASDTATLVRAALVHDLGVVAVPVRVWRNQSGAVSGSAEWEQVRLHPHWSARALARCPGLEQVGVAAGQHHERRDGSGYPAGLIGDLGRVSGLLACTVLFEELASARPADSAVDVADEMARLAAAGALDRRDVTAVLGAVEVAAPLREVERPAGLTEREVEVLRLLARGQTNRQIAVRLGISIKTVGAHVEHIYTKADVRSRAAATLFAMRNDLVS